MAKDGSRLRSGAFLVFLAALLFSTGGAAVKACALSGFQVAGFRSLFAAIFLLLWQGRGFLRGLVPGTFRVACLYATTLCLYVLANTKTTAADAIFLQASAPLYVLLLAPLLLHEKIRRKDVVVMLVFALGLSLFLFDVGQGQASAPQPMTGRILGACSGLSYGLTLIGLRSLGQRGGGQAALSAVVLGNFLAFAFGFAMHPSFLGASLSDWLVLLYLGVFQIGLAYIFLTRALRVVEAFRASLLLLFEPILNPVWAFALHGEKPGSFALAGGGIILFGTVLHALHGRKERAAVG